MWIPDFASCESEAVDLLAHLHSHPDLQPQVVCSGWRPWIQAVQMSFLQRLGEEPVHVGGSPSRATTSSHQKEWAQVVQASDQEAS